MIVTCFKSRLIVVHPLGNSQPGEERDADDEEITRRVEVHVL